MTSTTPYRHCLAALLSLLVCQTSWAVCAPILVSTSYALNGSITVARDTSTGTAINPVYNTTPSTPTFAAPYARCTSGTGYYFLKLASTMKLSTVADVYETNVPGIGVKVWYTSTPSNFLSNSNKTLWLQQNLPSGFANAAMPNLSFQFYVIGPVKTGQMSLPAPTVEGWVNDNSNQASAAMFGQFSVNSTLPVTAKACTTPDVSVALGKHKSTEFSGIGTTSSSTSFNLQLNNCATNLSSVSYSLAPVTSLVSGTAPYLTLDSASAASGVGIQLLDNNDALVAFNTKSKFNGYSSTGGSYTIALKARYIQTASKMQPGSANSSAVFTMSYE